MFPELNRLLQSVFEKFLERLVGGYSKEDNLTVGHCEYIMRSNQD